MVPRFFCRPLLAEGALIELPEALAHHAARVLRLEAGDPLVLFDGRGGEYPASMEMRGRSVCARLARHDVVEREAPISVRLAQVVPAGDRMDALVQKAVELGVASLVPLSSERSVVRLAGERAARRRSHWEQIAISACEQCGRNRIPPIDPIIELSDFLAESNGFDGLCLVLNPEAGAGIRSLGESPGAVTCLVGPEGGFTSGEFAAAANRGFRPLRLGPRTLRADTAGLAATAALLALWGDY